MGLCLEPFIGDLDSFVVIIGSKDEAWLQWAAELPDDPTAYDDDEPSASAAATAVVNGGPFHQEWAHVYMRAFRQMWSAGSEMYPNDHLCPFHHGYLDLIDKALIASGVTAVTATSLSYRPVQTPLPSVIEGFHLGQWTHEQCVAATEQWRHRDEAAADGAAVPGMEQLMDLAQAAAATPGHSVVTFLG